MSSERVESEGFYEMLWDCDHCDAKGLLGNTQRHCPNCGAPQNPDKRYFPKPGEEKRIDGHAYEGADRHCPACNAPMGASAKNCSKCGSPLDGSKEVKGVAAPVAPKKPRRRIWPYVLAALALLGFLIWYFFIRTADATLTVTGHRWAISAAVEKYEDYTHEAWRDQAPSGVVGVPLCRDKERSRKQVPDGEECTTENVDRKDGTFEKVKKCHTKYRSEPVMADWCTFTVRGWHEVGKTTAGGADMNPVMPATAPRADTAATLGATRSGASVTTRILDFGAGRSCEVSDAVWRKYKDGQNANVEVRARSGAVVCSSL